MLKMLAAASAALMLAAVPASAQTAAPQGRSTSIPFITYGGVRTFQSTPDGDGVYIQNNRRNWYYVSFFGRCHDLPWANRVGFKTFGGGGSLERGDTILAGNDRCRIADIVASGPPPKKVKKPKKARHG
jgi:hypothetical protein